jgi:glycosyltransferase involved in cell wall biosynthesis
MKVAVLNTHPIQYFSPLYKRLTVDDSIDLTVYYCEMIGLETFFDEGFKKQISWDIPLVEGFKHKFLKNYWKKGDLKGFFSLINPSILSELLKNRYDAIIIHGTSHFTLVLAILFSKLIGTKVFIRKASHTLTKVHHHRSKTKKWLTEMLIRMCNGCLAVGKLNRIYYQTLGIADEMIFLVPNAVDNDRFIAASTMSKDEIIQLKSHHGIDPELPTILFVSRFLESKRAIDLLQAYKLLEKKGIQANLLLIGSGEDEQNIRNYVNTEKLKNVHLLGFINQLEMPKYYGISDVFVLPSEDETWGLVINEAMCAGLPVVTSDRVGAAYDLIKNRGTGFIHGVGDYEQLATYLEKLLVDAELRSSMGKQSLKVISDWDLDGSVSGIKKAIN